MFDHVGSWKNKVVPGPRSSVEFDLKASEAAVVVVDLQNYSTHPDMGWAPIMRERYPHVAEYFLPRVQRVVLPNTKRLLDRARSTGLRIIFITLGAELPDGADLNPRRRGRASEIFAEHGQRTLPTKGTIEHQIPAAIAPLDGEIVINKTSKSAFTSTGIDQLLRNLGVRQVLFCGTATDSCVETTARDAVDHGYDCALMDDCCVTVDQDSHDATMRVFDRFFGRIMTVNEAIAELSSPYVSA